MPDHHEACITWDTFIHNQETLDANAAMRGCIFAPLAKLAARHRVAVVGVTHVNKTGGANALYRAMGSLAFVAAARAVWLVVQDDKNPGRRMMLPAKNNLAVHGTGLAYSLAPSAIPDVAHVAWEAEPVTITANEALAVETGRGPDRELRE